MNFTEAEEAAAALDSHLRLLHETAKAIQGTGIEAATRPGLMRRLRGAREARETIRTAIKEDSYRG